MTASLRLMRGGLWVVEVAQITVSARTVGDIAASVRFFLDNTRPKRLQIGPIYTIGRGEQADLQVDAAAFLAGYEECWQIAHERGVELQFSSARLDTLTSRFCRAYGEGFSLTPRGNVPGWYEVYDESADFAEDVIFGRYDADRSTYIFDEAQLDHIRAHSVASQAWCDGCFAKWHCSGDCPNKTRHAAVDGEFRGMPACEITRGILLHQLVRRIDDAGGAIWLEQAPMRAQSTVCK